MGFQKATKKSRKLRLALLGRSGSGKTYTALAIAKGLVGPQGRIAVIDTEHSSASLYSEGHGFDFDVEELSVYSVENYIKAIQEAEAGGYDLLIIDSLSHAWAGDGGILSFIDKKKAQNSFTAWADATPKHDRFIKAMMKSNLHLIVTMRTKMAYEIEKDDRGKSVPSKIGMQPVQRDGMEYEFDVIADINKATMVIDKTRCSALSGMVFEKAGQDVADILLEWLPGSAVDQMPTIPVELEHERTIHERAENDIEEEYKAVRQRCGEMLKEYKFSGEQFESTVKLLTGKSAADCSMEELSGVLDKIEEARLAETPEPEPEPKPAEAPEPESILPPEPELAPSPDDRIPPQARGKEPLTVKPNFNF